MQSSQLTDWIECSFAFFGKERLFAQLYKSCGSLQGALEAASVKRPSAEVVERIISDCDRLGIEIITRADPAFPKAFFATKPPVLLYAKGDISTLAHKNTAGIIGARNASDNSLRICCDFSGQLAANGVVIVSGFAAGIDQCAHKACIDAHGRTVAVLGCGIGCDYPSGSLELQDQICQSGVVISEFPPLSKPIRPNFPRRNRLIAALSEKLLVVQASGASGCLNTVSHALEQGKEVFVIPPQDIRSPLYQGQCALIRDGARIAFEPSDLL